MLRLFATTTSAAVGGIAVFGLFRSQQTTAAAKDDSAFSTLASKEGIRPTRPTLPYRVPADALDPSKFVKFKVAAVEDVSPDTKIVTFRLKPMQALGLQTASCVVVRAEIDGKPVIRPYTPMSDAYYRGSFKLLVKAYPDGKMSKHINSLKPGDYLEMKGPIQKLKYEPNMKPFIGMIAGGTGITPMYQVIREVLGNEEDHTRITLVYANRSEKDILLKSELDQLQAWYPRRFQVHYVVEHAEDESKFDGFTGFVTVDVAKKLLPPPTDETLILVCGPPGMMNFVSGGKAADYTQGKVGAALKALGFDERMVYKF